mgnify:CR=1 FL=1|jgi:hypothetical protein
MDELETLAKSAGVPEILGYLTSCSQGTLNHVERCLQGIVAAAAHPSAAYRSRVSSSLLGNIWESLWEYDSCDYLKGLILGRIAFSSYWYKRDDMDTRVELRTLANLWDRSESGEDVDEECEAAEEWDYLYLKERYLTQRPSEKALEETAGRALYYMRTGNMCVTVPVQEAIDYFGLSKL